MNFIKSESKNIIFFAVIVLAAFGVYYFYFKAPSGDELLTSSEVVAESGGSDLLVALLDLKTLKLDGELFEDEVFRKLKDFHVDIKPEPIGRDNPFAPTSGSFESGPSTVRIRTFESQ